MMDRETIIKLARESGIHVYPEFESSFERFAKLVAEHEREACAKVCEAHKLDGQLVHSNAVVGCAAAIRARGNT